MTREAEETDAPVDAIEEAEPGADEEEPDRGALALAGSAIAWVIGVVLIGAGILGLAGGGPGIVLLALGLLVTPRTRRELRELCRLLCR